MKGAAVPAREWPVVGRGAEVEALAEALGRLPVRAQILTGPPGIGKTVLADRVAARMSGREVVSVIGLTELASVPLGAFSPALATLGLPLDPAQAVPALVARVGRAPGEYVLIVDDAPRLDDVSAAAVYQLVRGFGVPMIATQRLGEPLPAAITKLVLEGFAEERSVDGLAVDDIQDLIARRFGAAGRRADAIRLAARTEGNPLYLRMLVEAAARDGAVRHTGGAVEIDDGPTPAGLVATIGAAVGALSPAERAALRFVSLTQPLDLGDAGQPVPGAQSDPHSPPVALPWSRDLFESLVARGALVRQVGSRAVRVAHPLLSDVLADDPETDAVVGDAVTYLRGLDDPSSRFTAIVLQASHGLDLTATDLLWAAERAFGSRDFDRAIALAEKAADAASDAPVLFRANLVLGSARSSVGNLDGADAAFEAAEASLDPTPAVDPTRSVDATRSGDPARAVDADGKDRALLASRRGEHLAFRRFDVAAAIRGAEEAQAGASPAVAATLDPELRLWSGLLGQMREHSGHDGGGEESPEMLVRGAVVSIMTESMHGRTGAAEEAASQLSDVQARFGVLDPFAAAIIGIETYFDLLSRGEHERAVEFAQSRRATAGEGAGIWTTTVAEHRSYNGRLREARQLSALAIDQLEWRDPFAILPLALAIRADLTAKSGDLRGARALIDAMAPVQRAEPKALMMISECEAWLAYAEGDAARAAAIIENAAEQAIGVGFHLVAAISLGVCIRIGAVDRAAGMLGGICAEVPADLRLYTALRDVAVALRDRMPSRMPTAAAALVAGGMAPTALDAIAIARRMRMDAETRHRLDRVALVGAQGVDAPLLHTRDAVTISAREREVAVAAAGRERSREIADRLGISPRTVENQLQSVYRKLGVSSRDELREVLREYGLFADAG